jgi:hypothetical protein
VQSKKHHPNKKTDCICYFHELRLLPSVAANGTGIYAVVAFPVPSVLVKDKKLI